MEIAEIDPTVAPATTPPFGRLSEGGGEGLGVYTEAVVAGIDEFDRKQEAVRFY